MALEEEEEAAEVGGSRVISGSSGRGLRPRASLPEITSLRNPQAPGSGGGALYQRAAEVTNVNRIGRARSVLRVKTQTRRDRDVGAAVGASPADLRRRIATASAAAASSIFDIVAYRDMTLAGAGTVATFHFMAHRTNALSAGKGVLAPLAIGPDLSGFSASPLPPVPASPPPAALLRTRSSIDATSVEFDEFAATPPPTVARPAPHEAPGLGLPPSARTAVQISWSLVKGRMDAVGKSVLAKLLTRETIALQLFGFRDDPNYLNGRSFKVTDDWLMIGD